MNENEVKKLYTALINKGFSANDIGDENTFVAKMGDQNSRKQFYDAISKTSFRIGDYDTFEKRLTSSEQVEQPASTPDSPLSQEERAGYLMHGMVGKRNTSGIVDDFSAFADNMREYGDKAPVSQNMEQPIESSRMFNPESGKMEKTYVTPSGSRYNNKNLADFEVSRYREAADMTVNGQLRRARAKLEELQAKKADRTSEVHDEAMEFNESKLTGLGQMLVGGDIYVAKQRGDSQKGALDVAIRQTEELIKDLEEQKDRDKGVDVGFWRGVGRTMGDSRTWDLGIGNMGDAITMLHSDKLADENATEGEKDAYNEMMSAIYNKEQADRMYGDNRDFWYKAGVTTGYMPSFMIDFIATGGGFKGLNLLSKGGAKAATRIVGKEISEEIAEKGFKQFVKDNGIKGFRQYGTDWTVKALGTMGDDLLVRAPMMANTVQFGKTASDIIDRKLGDVVVNEDGSYDFANDETWSSAIWQGEANAIVENFSEMFGGHLGQVVDLGKLGKLANVIGAKRLGNILTQADAGSLGGIMGQTQRLFNEMGVGDYFGEVTEEFYGQLWRTVLNLDDAYIQNPDGTRTNLFATSEFYGDVLGGMALSMGLMGAAKTTYTGARYASAKHNVNKADKRAAVLFGDEWEGIRATIDNTTNDNMGTLIQSVLAENYSTKEMNAILSYMESSMVLRGFNLGTLARSRGEQNEVAQQVNESYLDGYNASTPQEMNDAQNTYDLQREKALSLFYEEVLDKIDANPIMYLDAYSGKKRDVLLDYINAKQVRDGMIQRVRDDIDSRIEESNTMVDSRTNTDTGMIQGATMKVDDRKVYVVKGNLVQYDDKSGINNSASSESVIIRDAQTGKIEIVSPDAILNIDDAIDPNEEKATAAEVIRTTYAQAEADKMEGKVTFNPGDTYTLDTENGQMQVQITANEQGIVDNGDGTINVTDGQNIFPVTKQTFQDQVDAANKARVAQYDALQQAERNMENTPEYALNDKVVLRDANGNTINGQIAEVFADDGYYIVDVDVPINGSYAARMTRDELNNMLVEHNGVNVNTPSAPAQQAQTTPVAPTPSQQAQTPAVPQDNTALSRIPKDAQGNPIYEQTDADTAWDAIVEQTEGDEAMARSVAESMLKDKQTALSKAEKMQVKGGATIAEKIAAEKERKAIIDNAQREVELWQQIAGTVQRRQAAAEVQRKIEEEKRRIAEEAAAQQAKVEEEQSQAQTNQEELAVEDSEQEVADVASESEEKIDDSTITEQETPVQAEEQVQSEESPAESQETEQAETPTPAQPKESKNAKKLRKRAEKWMKDTGVTVRLLHSIDEVTNKSARAVIEAGNPVSGWFSNNEVVLYMPNINSVEGVDKTFIHEVVAHKGLRMLMGEQFDALCDNVWDMMSEEDRAKYIKYPGVKGNTRKAADEYMAYLAEGVDLNKTIWQKIIDAVREFFSSKDVRLLDEEIANLIKESYKNLKAQAATNVDNEVASIDGNDALFSIKTYREGGRDILQKFLKGRVKAKDLTKAEAEEMLNQMDDIYAICEEFKDKYTPFGNWSEAAVVVDEDGKPVFSVIKPNGDYAMNLDFSLVCKKRRTLDAVFREMINRGIISDYDLGQVDIAKINDIIRKYGFETACRLCFVDAKRFRVAMVADAFVGIYNPLTKMTDQQLKNVSEQMGDATEGKIARMLLKNPQNRIQLSRDNFMDSKGFEDIKANKAEIMSLYNAKKGTGGPKAALGDVQYLNDILKKRWSPKTAYSVGGVRLQSFSDYVPRMVFDYIQMIADLAAKKLPVHSYTKEVLFAQTFGLTGMKINLSLVPKVVEGGVAPGLDAEGNYAWQEGETFPYEEAMKLQNAEGYKENCGTIAVGVSDEHIQKLLDDDNIRMVIPYHKSGLNKQVAIHNNIDQFVDYTNEQNTRKANGKKLSKEQAKKHFNFNSDLQKHGNPRKAAENYLEWCRKNNYLPKFDKFQNHPNYYKLLEDFTTCITENGVDTFVPQGAVKMNFPTNESAFGSLSELIERGLEEDAILEGMKSEKIGSIVDDIQKALDEGQTMFRVANNNQEIFVSNARKAVESIKQEKATPEQWLAMLQKNGGLKAGEDKWMGLSDWLKESKSKTLSKQDVLDFVNENAIKIEEVKYMDFFDLDLRENNSVAMDLQKEWATIYHEATQRAMEVNGIQDPFNVGWGMIKPEAQKIIKERYGDKTLDYIDFNEFGEFWTSKLNDVYPINETRTSYATKGLENNREIALVVPTIESWNNGDEIHFGDAGDGRAIAWIRFGRTIDEEGNHVLVIDEIQSKRHQEGRDKGYRPNTEIYLKKNGIEVKESDEYFEFYKNGELDRRFAKDILQDINKAKDLYVSGLSQTDIPDAPFEKNWHELAFKRMLRLAAEEGFDKVAWTTGDQQAQRYSLSNGEGMKSFYDKMIPSFVSKYTKKWGAKVGEVTMPNLEENNTMWSVDITPEMQESVMEGQTMFRISKEEQQIIDDAKANGTYLKAPNGKATKLTPKQWVQVRTKAFKKWFGDWIEDSANASKIIDENGEPMVVYHDTNSKIFRNVETGEIWDELDWRAREEWKARDDWDKYWREEDFYSFNNKKGRRSIEMPAFFFTPNYDEYHEYGDRNIAAFLNIRNPKFNPTIKDMGVTDTAGEDAMNNLIEEGYDGFIQTEDGQWYETNAFFPNQIKSAKENEGTFNPEDNDIRFRISEEQDKAYIDAVEAGDIETAQAMVDSAAQAAGYNSPRLYHGTKSEFNVFNTKHNDPGSKGFFFTDSEEMASSYGKNIKQVYLRVEDPYVIEGNGRNWNNLHTDIFSVIPEIEDQIRAHEIAMRRFLENGDIKQSQYDYFRDKYYDKVDFIKDESKNSIFDIIKKYIYRWQIRNFNSKLNVDRTRDFEWLLQQLDSDVNIIFKDITDYGANITDYESIFVPHDVYVTTNPKNIKSADAVTYDDNGNVIPLSERFNEENDDVRFRVSEAKDKIKEIIGADGSSNKSIYAEGKTESGEKWVIRVSDHPARIENFKDKNEDADYILSIIIDEDFDSEFAHRWYHPITNDENTWQVVVNPKNIDYDVLSRGIDRFKRTGDGSLVWDGETETMFRIRQITDKERQTMINALSLSEGEEFYDNVFNGADQVVRENIVAIAAKNGWDFRKATEEYLGSLADNNPRFDEVKQIGLWDKVKGFFVDMLNKIGLNGFTKDSLADNDLRYILWRRFKNPKGRQDLFEKAEDIAKQYELGVGDYAEEEGDTLFRTNSSIRDRYDRAVRVPNKSGSVKWHENSLRRLKEAYYDGMHALKKLQDLIAEETGKPIQSYENSYEAENHMSSENKAQAEIFERDFFNPLKKVVQLLIKLGSSYEKLKTYIIAKHGLERNAYMRNKAVQNGENGDRDFSGLTDLTGIKDVADAEIEAQRIVDEYEKKYDTTELWEKINAATKETLRKSYDSGLISKETYEEVRDMYKYYIPLRGWDIDVASDEYEYLNSGRIMLSPALNKAKGRTSLADDPLATIGFMAESTIIQGNRNKVKMKFLNMALNHPTDLISVSEQWYVLDNATGEWEPRNPIIPDGATGDQVAAIVEQHEQQMIALGDKATKIKDGLKLNKNITKREGQEHVVRVKRNGKEYCLYINGSPRAAQAINGLLNPDINNSGLKKVANAIKHWMAAMFTSKNPTFIFLNLSRDVIWAGTSVAIKENAAYNARYTKNIAECLLKAQLPRLLKKFQNGTLDMNNELERYFDEFIRNGGETGFTQLHGVDDYKRNINRFVKEAQGKGFIVKKTWDGMIDNIEFMNRCAEDITRFMVYMTSRQMGRDVMTSVTDAKEITVNFNRKGSGGLGASLFNFCYLFFNASIQSAANFGKLLVKHPKKSAIALTLFSSAGFLVPMLNMAIKAMFSDDEDDNSYWDLPEWIRRNNIVLYVPWTESGYLTIPVPHELRPFYGMGEIAFSCLMGKEDVEDGLKKASLGFTQLIPLDFTGNGGNFWVNITPTIAQPIAQIITNKDYFGKPIYKKNDWNERSPEWTKAYKSTTPWLIDATKWLNEISGGDNVKKGKIDLNPALIEHIFESYTGGVGKTLNNAQKTFAMLWNEDLREWRNVPIIGSFYRTTEEQTAGSQINREYYEAVEEMKDVQHLVNGYKRELRMGNLEYAEKINELINSEIFKRYGVIYEFSNAIKEASDYLKLIDDTTDREKIETGIMNLKVNMFKKLEEINKAEELKNAEIAEEGNDDRK